MAPFPVDFAILTALREERDAVLAQLGIDKDRPLDGDGRCSLTYYAAEIRTARRDSAVYRVIVARAAKGPQEAAAAAAEVASVWKPRNVLLVGIAGGVPARVDLGDVLVAQQLACTTLGQMTDGPDGRPVRIVRWQGHQPDPMLLERADLAKDWEARVRTPRPEPGRPRCHFGDIASGGDVITSIPTLEAYVATWQNLIGVEMEGGAIALALARAPERPRFLMIRGVSDYADPHKYSPDTERWRAYACEVAAAYAVAYLLQGPVPAAEPDAADIVAPIEEQIRRVLPAETSDPPLAPDSASALVAPERALPELVKAAKAGRLAVLVGHGASEAAGLMTWRRLGERLKHELKKTGPGLEQIAELAGMYVDEQHKGLQDRRAARAALQDLITELQAAAPPPDAAFGPVYPRLARLPCRTFLTVCWDDLLARCLAEGGAKAVRRLDEQNVAYHLKAADDPSARTIVHLHGTIPGSLDHLIVSSDDQRVDFERMVARMARRLSEELAAADALLCVGLSPDEIEAAAYIGRARALAGSGARVFALVPGASRDDAARLWGDLGVHAVGTPGPTDRAAWVAAFLDALRAGIDGAPPTFTPPEAAPVSGAAAPAGGEVERESVDALIDRARVRAGREGIRLVQDWFRSWPTAQALRASRPLPSHRLLNTVFVDRSIHASLLEALRRGDKAGITGLVGMGGIGKTFLAMKIAHELKDEGWDVVWVGLLQQGLDDALDSLADAYRLELLPGLQREQRVAAIEDLFREVVERGHRTVVVLDNAERFPDLALLLRPLSGLPVLVTSRRRECADVVQYRKLDEMSAAEARELCATYLDRYLDGRYRRMDEEDRQDLARLCERLGHHPLGIQLVLSGFVRQWEEVWKGREMPFRRIQEAIAREGAQAIPAATDLGGGSAGESLHATVYATFEWLFTELPAMFPETGEAAKLALPIVAVVAHTPIDAETVAKAVAVVGGKVMPEGASDLPADMPDGIQRYREEANQRNRRLADAAPPWVELVARLRRRDVLDAALRTLEAIRLVERDEATGLFAVHPLIREFAFEERQRALSVAPSEAALDTWTLTGPNIAALYESALSVLSGRPELGESLLDLLPRLKHDHAVVEMACSTVRAMWDTFYFRRADWNLLRDLLVMGGELAAAARLRAHQGVLAVMLGDLECRMELPEGLVHLRTGVELLAEEKGDDNGRRWRLWALTLLASGYSSRPSPAEASDVLDLIRMNREARERAILGQLQRSYIAINLCGGASAREPILNTHDDFMPNLIVDLAGWVRCATVHLRAGACEHASALLARAMSRAAESGEAVPPSLGDELTIGSSLCAARHYQRRLAPVEIDRTFEELRARAQRAGIRGFALEAERLGLHWFSACAEGRWEDAVSLAGDIITATREMQLVPEPGPVLAEARLVATRAATGRLSASEMNDAELRLGALLETTRCWGLREELGWVLLGQGLVQASPGRREPRRAASALLRARVAFQRALGAEPVWVAVLRIRAQELLDQAAGRPVFDDLRDQLTPEEREPPDVQPWIVIGRRELPERVISRRDRRRMRLVQSGRQTDPDGREMWMYPFYVDEAPVTGSEYVTYLEASDRRGALRGPLDGAASVPPADAAAYATWAGKRLPSSFEGYAGRWQIGAGHAPERWTSWETALDRHIERIARAIEGDVASPYQTLPERAVDKISTSPEQLRERIERHWAGGFWQEVQGGASSFERRILVPLAGNTVGFPASDARELATLLACSISLTIEEKERMISSVPKLRAAQLEELLRIFREEREKFLDLDLKHANQLAKLSERYEAELLPWLLDCIVVPTVDAAALDGIWTDATLSLDGEPRFLPGDLLRDATWPGVAAPTEGKAIGIQCILPILVASDLEAVEPI